MFDPKNFHKNNFQSRSFEPQRVIAIVTSVDIHSLDWNAFEPPCIEFSVMVGETTEPKTVLRVHVREPRLCHLVAQHIKQGTWLAIDGQMEKDDPEENVFVADYIAAHLQYVGLIINPSNSHIMRKLNGYL